MENMVCITMVHNSVGCKLPRTKTYRVFEDMQLVWGSDSMCQFRISSSWCGVRGFSALNLLVNTYFQPVSAAAGIPAVSYCIRHAIIRKFGGYEGIKRGENKRNVSLSERRSQTCLDYAERRKRRSHYQRFVKRAQSPNLFVLCRATETMEQREERLSLLWLSRVVTEEDEVKRR